MIETMTKRGESVGLVERRYATWQEPLALDSGATLAPLTLAYETYGELSPARDNAILLLHALSGDAHAAGRHCPTDRKPGWWDTMVGSGRPFDTDRYFVICSNVLGGCQGSTGPSSPDPATGRPYGARFPLVTIGDMVRAQARLLDQLGIERLLAVAGGSMGGFQALEWAVAYPGRVRGTILLATTARSSPQVVAWNAIGRRAIIERPALARRRLLRRRAAHRWPGGGPDDRPYHLSERAGAGAQVWARLPARRGRPSLWSASLCLRITWSIRAPRSTRASTRTRIFT